MALAVCLFIVAGLTALGTITTIATAKNGSTAVAVTIINAFCMVVEILAAMRLIHGS